MSLDRKRYLDMDEVKKLRTVTEAKAIKDLQKGRVTGVTNWMLVNLALQTGLRVSEMANIRLKDIHLKRRYITVTRLKRKHPQSESLAIDGELLKHLRAYTNWKKDCGHPMKLDSPLFISKRRNKQGKLQALTAQGLQWAWKAEIKRAGLPKECSIHNARHTMAVHLLKKTKNLRQVQKQLGHASPTTTANMYADVSFADMEQGVTGLYA